MTGAKVLEEQEFFRVCYVGSARYSSPLGATDEKKFRALAALGDVFVIGFSNTRLPRRFTRYAHFYLFPELPLRFVRYVMMFLGVPFLLLWLVWRHRVRIFVAQSPYEGLTAALVKQMAGIGLALVGFLWALYIIVRYFFFRDLNPGWPALVSILMMGFGLTNISLGIIAEYLWRTLDVSRKRKVFIVDDILELS